MLEESQKATQHEDNANRCKIFQHRCQNGVGNTAAGVINNRSNTNNILDILEQCRTVPLTRNSAKISSYKH